MSRIDDLIAEHCPDGVEFKPLGDIAALVRGNGMPKSVLTDEGVGAIHYGQIYTRYGVWTETTLSYVAPETAARLATAEPGDIIITNTSENIDDVCKAVAWLGSSPIVTGGHATIIRHSLDPKYLSYWFQSPGFAKQKRALATGTKVIDVSAKQLHKVRVPVPPLEVQREIVRILDKFTALEAELEAELEARRTQYAHYRDQLIQAADATAPLGLPIAELAGDGYFGDGDWVESKDQDPSGEVRLTQLADVGVGEFRDRSDRWMRQDQAARLNCTLLKPGDILIARMPSPLGRACQVPDGVGAAATVVDVAILRSSRSDVVPRYVMHALNSHPVRKQMLAFQSGGTRQRISRTNLGKILVPLPTLHEQRRIASELDEFDALVNDLSVGLPAELAARRKQYEYYRDKLLTFKEAGRD
ncbi:restriction endonuclease subunit S [Demequina sp. B12]|uniref:restriction endonuclease subunit S n=1 Tax=Demequina sp. B12 TaxID=2992757 RepID=UPI00237B3C9F|nr:restriction endonuclease subunit S [Demequina sp. B12]MDE0573740.1 restriction endonuclease subunit S [Demequina sp. B12]